MNHARYLEPHERRRAAKLNVEMGDWVIAGSVAGDFAHDLQLGGVDRVGPAVLREVHAVGNAGCVVLLRLGAEPRARRLPCPCIMVRLPQHVAVPDLAGVVRPLWAGRIEPVNSRDDVSDYCAKYVTKEGSWWDLRILGHRRPDFTDFRLTGG